jgi:hypothetical protein
MEEDCDVISRELDEWLPPVEGREGDGTEAGDEAPGTRTNWFLAGTFDQDELVPGLANSFKKRPND